jgi:sulfoacetaldehyde dehydrogenase
MGVRHYMNVTRISRPIPERVPTEASLLGGFFERYGR